MNEELGGSIEMTLGLPLMSLPEYTLFPNTLVPFHVFESRYRQMLNEALCERRLLVVAGLPPGWELQSDGAEAVNGTVAGLGRILSDRRYADGRFDLFVHCIARVTLVRVSASGPYPSVDVEHLPDRPQPASHPAYQRLIGLASRLASGLGEDGQPLAELLAHRQEVGVLSNRLASLLVDRYSERQSLLAERCPVARCERLIERIAGLVLDLEPASSEEQWLN